MADQNHSEHKHGTMDVRAQEKTFDGFLRMSTWVAVISIGILIFAALVNG
jgi:Ni,Fe-hydrogenase I cytochrome b subunit